jgi:hypothetical protein
VLLLYGVEHVNLALADELALDGYEVRRASDPAKLRAVCGACVVELVIFGRATLAATDADGSLHNPHPYLSAVVVVHERTHERDFVDRQAAAMRPLAPPRTGHERRERA